MSRSASNLAAVHADHDKLVLVFVFQLGKVGRMWWQLMQQNVQKSSSTILPLQLGERDGAGIDPVDARPSS